MKIDNLIDAIADRFDCTCRFESDGTTVLLETWSPEGQDVEFETRLENPNSCEEFLEALKEHAANYDPDEEAALWLGSDGARFAQKCFDEDGSLSEQPRRMRVMVTRYGFIDVEASTMAEAEAIARNSRYSDFDWSNDMNYEVVDDNVI